MSGNADARDQRKPFGGIVPVYRHDTSTHFFTHVLASLPPAT
jgi:hypothetical protein